MNLFVYGTLLFPEIRELVGGRKFETRAAILKDYGIYRVKDATFPAIVKEVGNQVEGEILLDLSAEELARFDQYEDSFYLRTTETLELTSPGDPNESEATAECYIAPAEIAEAILSEQKWTKEWFDTNDRTNFVKRIKQFY